jgi:hypothetical protein
MVHPVEWANFSHKSWLLINCQDSSLGSGMETFEDDQICLRVLSEISESMLLSSYSILTLLSTMGQQRNEDWWTTGK